MKPEQTNKTVNAYKAYIHNVDKTIKFAKLVFDQKHAYTFFFLEGIIQAHKEQLIKDLDEKKSPLRLLVSTREWRKQYRK